MDTDIHARVREGWCGKQPYSNISGISDINGINGINVDVLGDTGDSHSLVDTQTQSAVEGNVGCLSADVKALVATASKIGTRIQYQYVSGCLWSGDLVQITYMHRSGIDI
ncbi:hypothetical protein SARC_03314 [Sphaeroforma arctica JP610]|uniref:Uncharacterized protein n=1 Tax=Sphaeroforma arctica JP610 TaxID=667725 RepID=A0A0L0G6H4_9EUKA|nr:hypothetical protein SARC_03314 [Sphaeroforma arctica JP610]KNC84481.1 hypothetical protein SARC_03314 [Sphaeroforma arctica JP610]|eukprot:XP_014158383.1 hypothetical protein SARC_03314 [Sphaeroforma arctica JP610]